MDAMFEDIERALKLRNGVPDGVGATPPSDRYHPKTEEGRRILEQLLAAQA